MWISNEKTNFYVYGAWANEKKKKEMKITEGRFLTAGEESYKFV